MVVAHQVLAKRFQWWSGRNIAAPRPREQSPLFSILRAEAVHLSVTVTADVVNWDAEAPRVRGVAGTLGNVGTTHGCGFMR